MHKHKGTATYEHAPFYSVAVESSYLEFSGICQCWLFVTCTSEDKKHNNKGRDRGTFQIAWQLC